MSGWRYALVVSQKRDARLSKAGELTPWQARELARRRRAEKIARKSRAVNYAVAREA